MRTAVKPALSDVVETIIQAMADVGPPDLMQMAPGDREAIVARLRREHGDEIRALVHEPGLISHLTVDDLEEKPAHRIGFDR